MYTDDRQARLHALRDALEAQLRLRSEQLTELTAQADSSEHANAETTALLNMCRTALADTAQALRYMAEGRYGICDGCGGQIPVERLEILPQARFCVSCQRRRVG